MHMCNSQDQLLVVEPAVSAWTALECFPKDGRAHLARGERRCVVDADRETLEELEENKELLECAVLEWNGKSVLLRVTRAKETKKRR